MNKNGSRELTENERRIVRFVLRNTGFPQSLGARKRNRLELVLESVMQKIRLWNFSETKGVFNRIAAPSYLAAAIVKRYQNPTAVTIGRNIYFFQNSFPLRDDPGSIPLIVHEATHAFQMERKSLGTVHGIMVYLCKSIFARLRGDHIYFGNPDEIDAYSNGGAIELLLQKHPSILKCSDPESELHLQTFASDLRSAYMAITRLYTERYTKKKTTE